MASNSLSTPLASPRYPPGHRMAPASYITRPEASESPLRDNRNAYTVEVQRISVKKKKTTYLESQSIEPPEGYTYLPVGFRKIKEICKDRCIAEKKLYHVVSQFPNAKGKAINKNTITRNIYRFGWHFPSEILLDALSQFGLWTPERINAYRNPLAAANLPEPGASSDNDIVDIVKDLFPNIPTDDLANVVERAFEKGTKRVGNAMDMPFPRRAQLAVLAHIRHMHTDYDSMLRTTSRLVARLRIEPKCLRILLKWRGEDDEAEFEERTEEVIVLDDDESDEDEVDFYDYHANRDHSPDVEVVSWRRRDHQLLRREDLPGEYFQPNWQPMQQLLMERSRQQGHTLAAAAPDYPRQWSIIQDRSPRPIAQLPYAATSTVLRPPAAPNSPTIVYDAEGRPFTLTTSLDYPKPPRGITPDRALPSIESEHVPRPIAFGNERDSYGFDFRAPIPSHQGQQQRRYSLEPRNHTGVNQPISIGPYLGTPYYYQDLPAPESSLQPSKRLRYDDYNEVAYLGSSSNAGYRAPYRIISNPEPSRYGHETAATSSFLKEEHPRSPRYQLPQIQDSGYGYQNQAPPLRPEHQPYLGPPDFQPPKQEQSTQAQWEDYYHPHEAKRRRG